MASKGKFDTILNAQVANGFGNSVNVDGLERLTLQIATAASGGATAATIKIYGSSSPTEPTWNNPATPANIYAPKLIYDLDTDSAIQGSSGIVLAGAEICKEYKINVEQLRWVNIAITGWSAGAISAFLRSITASR